MQELSNRQVMKLLYLLCVIQCPEQVIGQMYNLTGSSEAAVLGQPFTWTCGMYLPPGQNQFAVIFYRNTVKSGSVGWNRGECRFADIINRYTYGCLSDTEFNLTIPAENMTDYEQNTTWRCGHINLGGFESKTVTLNIAIDVHNISLSPVYNPLTIQEGSEFVVRCVVNSNAFPVPSITWILGSTDITNTVGYDQTTLSLTGNRSDNKKRLECKATNNNKPPRNASTSLNIEYKPEIAINPSSPYKIREGQTAVMACRVTDANPQSIITWRWTKEGSSTVLYNGANYTISNIQRGHSGTYNCTATNSIGTSDPATVQVDVQYKPQISITTPNPYRIREGQTANLTCVVNAANPSTITEWRWTKEGSSTVLYSGANYTISNIQRGHSGTYNCTATNSIGTSDPATVQVDVQYKPQISITTPNPYRIREGQTANLTCVVNAANPSAITEWRWIKEGSSTVLYRGANYTIPNIQRGHSGTYRCTATNSIGTSDPATVQVDVQYKPQISITTPNPYRIRKGQTANLTCVVSAASPSTITEWRWTKEGSSTVLYRGANYTIPNIQRSHSGTYRCTATNSIGTSDPATVQIDVQYGPAKVTLFPDVKVINKTENQTVTPITCSADCNPACSFTWTRVGMSALNSEKLDLGQLKRTERGVYTCTATNSFDSYSTTISVIVNYPPNIKTFQTSNGQTFEEASSFNITCIVDSFPLSQIYIRNTDTGEVKESGGSIETLTYSESSAKCYQTANYSCHSENVYGSASSSIQRIFILCKPRPSTGQLNIKIGIKTGEGLNISTNFIGYPLPQISWKFKKNITDGPGSVLGTQQIYSVPLNVSTIQAGLMKENLNQEEFGYYVVTATTPGKPNQISTVNYHVIPQRKPNPPYNVSVNCKMSRGTALVNWEPGFDGGAAQMFLVSYKTRDGIQKNSTEKYLYPNATLINLEDYTEYKINIIASNIHGETLSEEEKSCKTIEYNKESSNTLPMIIGGAVGGLVVAGVVILGIVFILRRMSESEGKKNDQRKNILNEERETDEDDGLKDNILYVSAGPTDNEKPGVSGTAVYAEVNKKGPTSDNNANVYAEVQKPGKTAKNKEIMYSDKTKPKKGIFKKEEKPKQKKDKKLKQKKENSDVYENAEDIAMTANLENVYSNAAESNGTTSENRGYKNQDGLLYVEVQFDRNQKNEKPVIHGEDEKTDYATVEFPFPPSSDNKP